MENDFIKNLEEKFSGKEVKTHITQISRNNHRVYCVALEHGKKTIEYRYFSDQDLENL